MNKETVQKNVYILHLNYRTVYCPKKALNSEMGNTVIWNVTRFEIDTQHLVLFFRAILGWNQWCFHWEHRRTCRHVDPDTTKGRPIRVSTTTLVYATQSRGTPFQVSVCYSADSVSSTSLKKHTVLTFKHLKLHSPLNVSVELQRSHW